MSDHMHYRVTQLAEGTLVAVSGEIDITSAPSLAEALVQATHGTVIVDLADVTFFDASGACALLAARRNIERRGGRFMVKDTSRGVRRVLHVAGIEFNGYANPNDRRPDSSSVSAPDTTEHRRTLDAGGGP